MALEFRIARTRTEKERVYRLRYDVYIEEMGWLLSVDHEKKLITDWMDSTATIFYGVEDGQVVATGRSNWYRDGAFELEAEYQIGQFVPYYPDRVTTTTKTMIRKDYRRSDVTVQLVSYMYEEGMRKGAAFDFINSSGHLFMFYEKLGYRLYIDNIKHSEYGQVVPMVLALDDIGHLLKVRSPLLPICRKYVEGHDRILQRLNSYSGKLRSPVA